MCDYSLHGVASRAAKIGDKLVTSDFRNTLTRGFSAVGEPELAVCLLPGTELVFERQIELHYAPLQTLFFRKDKWKIPHTVGRFRQIDVDKPNAHHDAVEFPDGRIVLLTRLRPGQQATVLQLPRRSAAQPGANPRELTASRADLR